MRKRRTRAEIAEMDARIDSRKVIQIKVLGELHCLSCARHLADLVRWSDGRARFDHPAGQESRPILLDTQATEPLCARCGGRVLVERPLAQDVRPHVRRAA